MDKVPKKRAPVKAKEQSKPKLAPEAVLPVQKVAKKSTPQKPLLTKAISKSKPNSRVVKKLLVKKVNAKATKNHDEVKLVPGTISLRLAEKRKLYERVYQDYVPKIMRPVAINGGYAYITIGIFLAILMSNPTLSNIVSQTASVLCFNGECQSATTTDLVNKEVVKPAEFKPVTTIIPATDTNLQLAVNLNLPVKLVILPIFGGDSLTISGVAESASNIVNFLLPTATLSNGSYLIQAELYDEETKQVRVRIQGPTINVANPVAEIIAPTPVVDVDNTEMVEDGEVLGVSTSTTETLIEVEEALNAESELLLAEVDEEVETVKPTSVKNTEVFELVISPGTTSNQSVLKILPTFVFDKVELALKLKGDGETFFLGQATKANEAWFYWLDNSVIPNGLYTLIIRGFDKGELKEEATFTYTNNTIVENTPAADRVEVETRVNSLLADKLEIEELTQLRDSYATSYLEINKAQYGDDYLTDYLPKLDELYFNYAAAVAGGIDALIILADEQIEKYLDRVIVASNKEENFSYELTAVLLDIKEYVRTKEAEVTKLSGGDSAFDIDKDGLTDYDEVVTYETDHKLPDTDSDGILDSIEILSGFSPTSDELEAVSRFSGELERGVINGELLAIETVEPYYLYTEADTNPKVLTSISGKGIPNSFVRLYLGDNSESVIVKVGPSGAFTQTIDKDYVRLEGEVVLAVTDNTGKIIIRGPSLQLNKVITSKQLFNSSNLDAALIKSVEDFKISNIIGAVGVVSFGLILLLLGKAIAPRREPISLEIA